MFDNVIFPDRGCVRILSVLGVTLSVLCVKTISPLNTKVHKGGAQRAQREGHKEIALEPPSSGFTKIAYTGLLQCRLIKSAVFLKLPQKPGDQGEW
jgi:hypothetical protein